MADKALSNNHLVWPQPGKEDVAKGLGSETGSTAGAGQHAGGLDPVTAGGTVEPVTAKFALNFRKSLLFLAFRATPVHFPIEDVFREKKAALEAFLAAPLFNLSTAVGQWAGKNRFTTVAPVFPFFELTANRAFVHGG